MFHTGDSFLRLCRDGDYKSVQRLVIKIAETNSTEQQEFINRKDSSGNSPIHYATKPGNEKVNNNRIRNQKITRKEKNLLKIQFTYFLQFTLLLQFNWFCCLGFISFITLWCFSFSC